jgi:hypothetical protein
MSSGTQEVIQQGVADALAGTRARRNRLDSLSPVQKEEVARWIESKFSKLTERIQDGEALLKEQPTNDALRQQVYYWRVAVAVSKQLAYYARTQKPSKGTTLGQ